MFRRERSFYLYICDSLLLSDLYLLLGKPEGVKLEKWDKTTEGDKTTEEDKTMEEDAQDTKTTEAPSDSAS